MGWLWETIYCTVLSNKWENRGFLFGPVCPIYGTGSVIGLLIYDCIMNGFIKDMNVIQVFLISFVFSMLLEYPTSWFLEKRFNARWWDYSKTPLNINGRTSVPTSICFGFAGVLIVKILIPFFSNLIDCIHPLLLDFMSLFFIAILFVDITLTVSALTDFQKRVADIDNGFQNRMTEAVSHFYNDSNGVYHKVIKRVAVFKFSEKRTKIAKAIKEKKLNDLIIDFFESDTKK